jgi:hypothetical protein
MTESKIRKYRLKRELPQLPAGVIFEHRPYSVLPYSVLEPGNPGNPGSPACGAMVLYDEGHSQGGWCGETYWLPGQLADDREWFEPVGENMDMLDRIRQLKEIIATMERKLESQSK